MDNQQGHHHLQTSNPKDNCELKSQNSKQDNEAPLTSQRSLVHQEQSVAKPSKCSLSKKNVIVLVSILGALILISVSIAVGLNLHLKTEFKEGRGVSQVQLGQNTFYRITQFVMQNKHLFEPNEEIEIVTTQIIEGPNNVGRVLVQTGEDKISATVIFKKFGIRVRIQPSPHYTVIVDPSTLINYFVSEHPGLEKQINQINLQYNSTNLEDEKQQERAVQDFMEDLTKAFKKQFAGLPGGKNVKMIFLNESFIDYCFNETSNRFERICDKVPSRRLLCFFCAIANWFQKQWNSITNWVKGVVTQVVNYIQKVPLHQIFKKILCDPLKCKSTQDPALKKWLCALCNITFPNPTGRATPSEQNAFINVIKDLKIVGTSKEMKEVAKKIHQKCFSQSEKKIVCGANEVLKIDKQTKAQIAQRQQQRRQRIAIQQARNSRLDLSRKGQI